MRGLFGGVRTGGAGESGHALFTTVRGLRTHAWVRGSGPPLVLVPGLGCASWMYTRVARELAVARTVYVYDPPGHGHSAGRRDEPPDIAGLSDHLAAWLQATGLNGAPLLGHSLGGEVIFDLAARHPRCTSALIACAPTGVPEHPSVPEQLWRLLRDLPLERPQLLGWGLRAYLHCGTRRMWQLAQAQSRHHVGAHLPFIHVPTLLLDGLADPVIQTWTVEAIRRAIRDSTIREIGGGTHALTDSHPRAVARYTLDFLEAVEAG